LDKKDWLLALMVATILLFWGSEQKIVHAAGIWIIFRPDDSLPRIIIKHAISVGLQIVYLG